MGNIPEWDKEVNNTAEITFPKPVRSWMRETANKLQTTEDEVFRRVFRLGATLLEEHLNSSRCFIERPDGYKFEVTFVDSLKEYPEV